MKANQNQKAKKRQLAQWFVNEYSDCGFNNYRGYKMTDDDFFKELMKKKKWELINQLFNHSVEGQLFLAKNGYGF